MREADVAPALAAAMDSVLEQMFFVTEIAEAEPPEPGAVPTRTARVRFSGEPGGWIDVLVGMDAAANIAADFLALDPGELTPSQIDDVVLEFANMLCGAAVSRLETDATIRLTAPALLEGETPAPDAALVRRSVSIGSGVITARFHFETPCLTANEPKS
jgi:CheY-specific phosphatase CheX